MPAASQPTIRSAGDRPAQAIAQPGTARLERTGHAAEPASLRARRQAPATTGDPASLPGWPVLAVISLIPNARAL